MSSAGHKQRNGRPLRIILPDGGWNSYSSASGTRYECYARVHGGGKGSAGGPAATNPVWIALAVSCFSLPYTHTLSVPPSCRVQWAARCTNRASSVDREYKPAFFCLADHQRSWHGQWDVRRAADRYDIRTVCAAGFLIAVGADRLYACGCRCSAAPVCRAPAPRLTPRASAGYYGGGPQHIRAAARETVSPSDSGIASTGALTREPRSQSQSVEEFGRSVVGAPWSCIFCILLLWRAS